MKDASLSGSMPKRNLYVEIIASLLIIFFAHTATTSYIQIESLKNLLAFYTLNRSEVAWTMISTELIIAILLLFPRTRKIGLFFTLLFGLTALIITIQTPHYPHDFGGIVNSITRKQKYAFYAALTLISIIGIILSLNRLNIKPSNKPHSVVYT